MGGHQQTEKTDSSLGPKTGGKSSLNRNDAGGLKQTAQFGPQMNLIKSQLPHQQPGGVGLSADGRIQSGKSKLPSDRTMQSKQLASQQQKMNLMRQAQVPSGAAKQNHYMTVGQGQSNQQRPVMIL